MSPLVTVRDGASSLSYGLIYGTWVGKYGAGALTDGAFAQRACRRDGAQAEGHRSQVSKRSWLNGSR